MTLFLSIVSMLTALSGLGDLATGTQDARGAVVSIPLKPREERTPVPLPEISGAKDSRRPLIVIDPGHGGDDPGATSSAGQREKDVTLLLARRIHDRIASSNRFRVALTRTADAYVPLTSRFDLARRMKADLFISIHADAAPLNQDARGASIYTLSEIASDREAALLARRENEGGAIGGADMGAGAGVNRILIDLAQRESMSASADFARLLYREASPLIPFQADYRRFASFVVLKAPDIPSVLFESGYLTNEADAAFILSAEGRQRVAQGMYEAIETYFARRALAPAA